ncbi:MAG: metallophosphoesterase family protein [Acidimicrobiia bacterium]
MRITQLGHLAAALSVATLLAGACSGSPSAPTTGGGNGGAGGVTAQPRTVTMLGVGDIGMCGRAEVAQTARLVAGLDGELLLAGDLAYPQGTAINFRDCFNPSWGQFRSRWHAVPGNHEYESPGADPYFQYFGGAAGDDGTGHYAFTAGEWNILMLNSNVAATRNSPQWEFVRAQLDAQRTPCTLAVWHHPLFSSGPNGNNNFMRDMWALLETGRVEAVLNGHDHWYERFARQTSDGRADPVNGIRQFTSGAGGADLYSVARVAPNSEERLSRFGVVRLTLRPAQLEWEFLTIDGTVADRGLDTCR